MSRLSVPLLPPTGTEFPQSLPAAAPAGPVAPAVDATLSAPSGTAGALPAPPATSVPPASPAGTSIRDLLGQRGVDASGFRSDDELVAYLGQLPERISAYERLAAVGQRFLPHAADFEDYLKAKEAAAPVGAGARSEEHTSELQSR